MAGVGTRRLQGEARHAHSYTQVTDERLSPPPPALPPQQHFLIPSYETNIMAQSRLSVGRFPRFSGPSESSPSRQRVFTPTPIMPSGRESRRSDRRKKKDAARLASPLSSAVQVIQTAAQTVPSMPVMRSPLPPPHFASDPSSVSSSPSLSGKLHRVPDAGSSAEVASPSSATYFAGYSADSSPRRNATPTDPVSRSSTSVDGRLSFQLGEDPYTPSTSISPAPDTSSGRPPSPTPTADSSKLADSAFPRLSPRSVRKREATDGPPRFLSEYRQSGLDALDLALWNSSSLYSDDDDTNNSLHHSPSALSLEAPPFECDALVAQTTATETELSPAMQSMDVSVMRESGPLSSSLSTSADGAVALEFIDDYLGMGDDESSA